MVLDLAAAATRAEDRIGFAAAAGGAFDFFDFADAPLPLLFAIDV
jgi:hypothetical protein